MPEATFTFRVDDSLKLAFAEAARLRDSTGAQLLRDYMREYVRQSRNDMEYDAWFRRKVDLGMQAAKDGEFVSPEEVKTDVAARRAIFD
jgi:predicted transcriptional regulator